MRMDDLLIYNHEKSEIICIIVVVAFVPAVLLCALVRICSQRRQLDFATIDGDLHALEAMDTIGAGGGLRRPRSLPAFESTGCKKGFPGVRGGKFLAVTLRRSRSTEDFLPHPPNTVENFVLKPLKYDESTTRNFSHLLLTEDAIRGGGGDIEEKRDNCSFQLAPVVKRNRNSGGNPVNRMIMSCWSGDFSMSSLTNSSSTANSPVTRRMVRVENADGEDDCDVCRQMRQSGLIMSQEDGDNRGTSNSRVRRKITTIKN